MSKSFTPLKCKPNKSDKYIYLYNNASNNGKSPCITGKPVDKDCNVLCNCVGWACGRFNHIYNLLTGFEGIKYPNFCCNAEKFIEVAKQYNLEVGQIPKPGAIMCWQKGATLNGSDGSGHVAVVEQVISNTQVLTSESGYNNFSFANKTRSKADGNWGAGSAYKFRGFIYNPAVEEEKKCETQVVESSSSIVHSSQTTNLNNTEKDIWVALKAKGLTDIATSGIMGCWGAESANKANRVEGDYLKSFPGCATVMACKESLNDYTKNKLFPAYEASKISINKNAYKGNDGLYYSGIGLAQWTGQRACNLVAFAKSKGTSFGLYTTQIDFFWNYSGEFNSRAGLKDKLNKATTPEEAATIFLDGFEMYSGWHNTATGKKQDTTRRANARKIYNTYHTSSTSTVTTTSCTCSCVQRDTTKNQIQVLVNNLRIRNGAGTNCASVGMAKVGYYNYYESKVATGYTWYRIGTDAWIAYNSGWEKVYPATVATSKSNCLSIGDCVTLDRNATVCGKTTKFASWVYKTKLYVREISGDKVAISIYKTGGITGIVDKKYIIKK